MIQGCFSYDKKGPLHIYLLETAQQKKATAIEIKALNLELEPKCREEWELQVNMGRLKLHPSYIPGRIPTFTFTKKTSHLERDPKSKDSIDQYLYYNKVLIPKLIPFVKEYMVEQPNTIILEDRVPPHSYHFQQRVYDSAGIAQLLDWPGNSPDLNAIKPIWPFLKQQTTS